MVQAPVPVSRIVVIFWDVAKFRLARAVAVAVRVSLDHLELAHSWLDFFGEVSTDV